MTYFLYRLIAIFSLLSGAVMPVSAQTPSPAAGIRVLVYGTHYGGNIVYNYKVINNGDAPFSYFTIGSNFENTDDGEYPQLTRLPLGWAYGREGETGPAVIIPSGSTTQPPYWNPWIFGQQDTYNYYLKWRCHGSADCVIRPGQTLAGFSVIIPLEDSNISFPMVTGQPVHIGPDEMYLEGGFKVGFGSDKKWGTLERLDTTPPTLTVSLSPNTLWPPNDKLVPVTATITVKDDYDPQPEIMLVSIVANDILGASDGKDIEPGTDDRQFQLKAKRMGSNSAGRIYTVTYSATDGSGNKSTASATVTVPHDQGK